MLSSGEFSLALFDLGGVLCRFRPQRRLALLASACGKSPKEVDQLLWQSGFSRRCDQGEFSRAAMHQRACELLDWSVPYVELLRAWASAFDPDPLVLALVEGVRCTHATGLLTDNPPVLMDALGHELREVGSRFDLQVFSCALRSLKPSEPFFRAALVLVRRPAEEVLFIDDVQANIDAATALA